MIVITESGRQSLEGENSLAGEFLLPEDCPVIDGEDFVNMDSLGTFMARAEKYWASKGVVNWKIVTSLLDYLDGRGPMMRDQLVALAMSEAPPGWNTKSVEEAIDESMKLGLISE